jgi:hypothetical protein
MTGISFAVSDARRFGLPRHDLVSTSWARRRAGVPCVSVCPTVTYAFHGVALAPPSASAAHGPPWQSTS